MKKKHLLDKPKNVKRFFLGFYTSLVLLIIVDFFIPKHPFFPMDGHPSFYAVYGFVACVGLVLLAKYVLRPLVKRGEDYYD